MYRNEYTPLPQSSSFRTTCVFQLRTLAESTRRTDSTRPWGDPSGSCSAQHGGSGAEGGYLPTTVGAEEEQEQAQEQEQEQAPHRCT